MKYFLGEPFKYFSLFCKEKKRLRLRFCTLHYDLIVHNTVSSGKVANNQYYKYF